MEAVGQEFPEHGGCPRQAEGEYGEACGDKCPEPRFQRTFLVRRFINPQLRLWRQCRRQLVVRGTERVGCLFLQLDRPGWRTRLLQDRLQEQGRSPLALAEVGHQQGHKCHQPWPSLPHRHSGRQLGTCAFSAAWTNQSMLLIFRHVGLDFGKFPHLMPQRLGICAGELLAATSALLGFQRLDIVTLFGRQECSLVLGVPWLPTALFPGLRLAGRGFCVRMLSAGRQRRVLRCLVELLFQFLNLCQQQHG